ncbi:11515_t:CDS:2, partial [Racocetra fulgida]
DLDYKTIDSLGPPVLRLSHFKNNTKFLTNTLLIGINGGGNSLVESISSNKKLIGTILLPEIELVEETLPSLKEFNKWDSPFVKYFANHPHFLTWIFDLLNKKHINQVFYRALEVMDKDPNAPEELRTAIGELMKTKKVSKKEILAEKENHAANVVEKKNPNNIIKTQFVPKLKWSMKVSSGNSICSDVEKILLNFRDLFIKCKNEKLELICFNPNEKHPNHNYALRFSKCLLLARVYILDHILRNYENISTYNWTILQLFPNIFFGSDIFLDISLKFREATEEFLD